MERKSDRLIFLQLRKMVLGLFIVIQVFAVIALLPAHSYNYSFTETHDIRREFKHLITAPNNEVARQQAMILECFLTGKKVRFQVVRESDSYYFVFINERANLLHGSEFPMVSAGTYIIRRDAMSGVFTQIKIFLNNDPDTFVRIAPHNEGSILEFSLFNSMVYRNILIPMSIDRLITEPFETIVKLSEYIINWNMLYAFYNETENKLVMNISREIDKRLHTLNDSDDGAQAWNGDFVFIRNNEPNPGKGFNCSGFAKWVADGIYSAKNHSPSGGNRLMDIEVLKKKHLDTRKDTLALAYENERDPFFGLDWTRNIAMTIYEHNNLRRRARFSDVDIRDFPYEDYSDDIGYSVANLKAILYYLTVTDPGYIYLGSVNGNFGKDPVLRQHYHVVVFTPYIDSNGNFFPIVYERNIKRPFNDFLRRNPRESIHLVRIKAEEAFFLSEIPPISDSE